MCVRQCQRAVSARAWWVAGVGRGGTGDRAVVAGSGASTARPEAVSSYPLITMREGVTVRGSRNMPTQSPYRDVCMKQPLTHTKALR